MNESILAKHILLDRSCYNCSRVGVGFIECYREIEEQWRWDSVSKDKICDQWDEEDENLH